MPSVKKEFIYNIHGIMPGKRRDFVYNTIGDMLIDIPEVDTSDYASVVSLHRDDYTGKQYASCRVFKEYNGKTYGAMQRTLTGLNIPQVDYDSWKNIHHNVVGQQPMYGIGCRLENLQLTDSSEQTLEDRIELLRNQMANTSTVNTYKHGLTAIEPEDLKIILSNNKKQVMSEISDDTKDMIMTPDGFIWQEVETPSICMKPEFGEKMPLRIGRSGVVFPVDMMDAAWRYAESVCSYPLKNKPYMREEECAELIVSRQMKRGPEDFYKIIDSIIGNEYANGILPKEIIEDLREKWRHTGYGDIETFKQNVLNGREHLSPECAEQIDSLIYSIGLAQDAIIYYQDLEKKDELSNRLTRNGPEKTEPERKFGLTS